MWKIAELMKDIITIENKRELKQFLKTKPVKDYDFYSLGEINKRKITKKEILNNPYTAFMVLPKVQ